MAHVLALCRLGMRVEQFLSSTRILSESNTFREYRIAMGPLNTKKLVSPHTTPCAYPRLQTALQSNRNRVSSPLESVRDSLFCWLKPWRMRYCMPSKTAPSIGILRFELCSFLLLAPALHYRTGNIIRGQDDEQTAALYQLRGRRAPARRRHWIRTSTHKQVFPLPWISPGSVFIPI